VWLLPSRHLDTTRPRSPTCTDLDVVSFLLNRRELSLSGYIQY
jgi:hypothetical protein